MSRKTDKAVSDIENGIQRFKNEIIDLEDEVERLEKEIDGLKDQNRDLEENLHQAQYLCDERVKVITDLEQQIRSLQLRISYYE